MNAAQKYAVASAICTDEDNLYRAELQMSRSSEEVSVAARLPEYIAKLRARIAELKEGL